MQQNVKLETIVFGIFYLVLFGVFIVPLQKLINSPTAFEEFQIGNKADLPSITICPYTTSEGDDKIKDFNHASIAIEKAKKEYHGFMGWLEYFHG